MENFIEHIEKKLSDNLNPKKILVIDNSYLHKKHKSFKADKFHLKLIIDCPKLKKMNPIDANRLIFSILKDEIKNKIHALQIDLK